MIFEIVLLLLGIPAGMLIARLTEDELKEGRKWFYWTAIMGVLAGIWFYLVGKYDLMWTFFFLSIISFVSYTRSFRKI